MMKYDLETSISFNWAKNLEKYANNLNDIPKETLGWETPFTVFFGRKKVQPSSKKKTQKEINKKVLSATSRVNSRSIIYSEKRLKTPTYEIGDTVLVRLRSKRSRVSGKAQVGTGTIVKRNLPLYRYKINFLGKNTKGAESSAWFSVREIIAETLQKQRVREQRKEINTSANQSHKMKFLIPLTHTDRLDELMESFGLTVEFDPLGDGNCQFSAVNHQLALNHISHENSAAVLRACNCVFI